MAGKISRVISMILPAILLCGCFVLPDAKSPKTGAVATGEPLAVVDDVKVWTTTSKEKVGEVNYKDDTGQTVGSADVYQEKTHVHSMKVWYPVQGNEQLSDEDFFRISGDQKALDATLAMRANAKKWNKRGKITIGVGLVALVGGYFVPNTVAKSVLMIGGGLAVSGGWSVAFWSARQMAPENHAVDRSIAQRAANQYNAQLGGHSAGLSMARKF